jgi:hypothetical protein
VSTLNRPTVRFEELAYSNMLTANVLIELSGGKGLIDKKAILEQGVPSARLHDWI